MFLLTWWLIFIFPSVSVQAARDGDVRLVGSNRYGTGRVEVFYEGSWGTICHRGWDLDDAEVICRQLNFPNGAQRSFFGARFGEGSGRVLLSDVNCVGEENNLLECDNVQNNWAMNNCQHALDVGVQCSAPNYEGCFQITFLRAAEGFQSDEMTIETCFELCARGRYSYFWMHNGGNCDCGNTIDATAQVDNEDCATDCPGNSDQRCGGRDLGSVYKVEVDLPYVASPGFPGRFISTGNSLPTRNFNPQGVADYSFIRFHQLDLPTLVNLSVSSNDRTDMFQGGIGINEYWTASANSPIQISFQLAEGNIDSAGFLLEFREGSYCPTVTSVPNGRLSTTATVPYTVGTQIRVMCNSGFMAYDDTVFCQADGSFNRDIMCIPGGPTTARSTQQTQQPTQRHRTTLQSPPKQSSQQPRSIRPTARNCSVPAIANGEINSNAPNIGPGDDLMVTCSFPYKAVESTITCQRNGTFTESAECILDPITIIVLSVVSVVALVTIVLILGCLVRIRTKRVSSSTRNMKGSPRNERVTASNSASLQLQYAPGYETPQTVTSRSYDRHIVDTAKTTTPCCYDRQIDYTGDPRDDNIGYYNQGSVQVIPPYYNIKSDPNNHLGIACGSKLDQNYSYEDVQLWS